MESINRHFFHHKIPKTFHENQALQKSRSKECCLNTIPRNVSCLILILVFNPSGCPDSRSEDETEKSKTLKLLQNMQKMTQK
jgi:hypothetical protein